MNLICPARLILLPPGSGDLPAGERIAQVYASPIAEDGAAALAGHLGVPLTVLRLVAEAALQEIADAHRGETVVLIAPDLRLGITPPAVIHYEGDGWQLEQ